MSRCRHRTCARGVQGYQGRAGVSVGRSGDFRAGVRRMFGCYRAGHGREWGVRPLQWGGKVARPDLRRSRKTCRDLIQKLKILTLTL